MLVEPVFTSSAARPILQAGVAAAVVEPVDATIVDLPVDDRGLVNLNSGNALEYV